MKPIKPTHIEFLLIVVLFFMIYDDQFDVTK